MLVLNRFKNPFFTIIAFFYLVTDLIEANSKSFPDYKEHLYRITSQDNFIIIDGQEAQRYRLFGILPFLHTFWVQIALFCFTVAVIFISSWLFIKTRISNKGTTLTVEEIITTYLPEPIVRLLFYIQFEGAAFWSTLLEDIMSVVHAPLNIGLNLASRLSYKTRSTFDDSSDDSYALSSFRGSRGRRRKQTPNSASSSRSASHANGQGQHYAGLWNTGNSCFLNSTLQSITSIATVQDVLEEVIEQAEQWDVPTPVTDALYDLILQLNTPSTSRHAVIPRQLTDALSNLPQTKVGSFFYAHQQQDAHELLVLLTSAIDDEMNAIIAERNAALESYASGLKAALLPSIRPASTNLTPFNNPFRALVAQRTACLDCGYVEAVRHYPTDELSLNVAVRPGSATTIEACLAHWSKLEVVDWICFRCSLVRTINRLKDESMYLESQAASASSPNESSTSNGHAISLSTKKKSGAKRRKAKDMKGKVDILTEILAQGYSEDEVEAKQILSLNDIKLDRTFSRAATKQVMLARTPRVLVLHLNRSSYSASSFGASKNNAAVLFDDELDLSDIVTGGDLTISGDRPISRGATPSIGESAGPDLWSVQGRKGKSSTMNGHHMETDDDGYVTNGHTYQQPKAFAKTRYRLSAIVVHYGNHSSGHYVSFRRRKPSYQNGNAKQLDGLDGFLHPARDHDRWYRISDDSVKQCTLEDVRSQNPFLMFYERIGDDAQRLSKSRTNGHTNGTTQNGHGQASDSSGSDADHRSTLTRSSSHIPQGFEVIAQKQENALHPAPFKPRVFHRWESSPSFATEKIKAECD